MNKLSTRVVLSIRPKEYLKQGPIHCGMYAIKGILSAYGLDRHKNPEDYHPNFVGKITGTTLPWTFPQVLRKYGLRAEIKLAQDSKEDKINLLKTFLQKDQSIVLLIGNGYRQNGDYSLHRAKFSLHWVTLWGFDDSERVFYVYDSAVPKDKYDKDTPIGNKKRKYEDVVRDWGAGIISFGFWKYLYISVTKS